MCQPAARAEFKKLSVIAIKDGQTCKVIGKTLNILCPLDKDHFFRYNGMQIISTFFSKTRQLSKGQRSLEGARSTHQRLLKLIKVCKVDNVLLRARLSIAAADKPINRYSLKYPITKVFVAVGHYVVVQLLKVFLQKLFPFSKIYEPAMDTFIV